MNKKVKNNKGFTLIETLIAIAILVLAIVGPLTIAANSLFSAYYASDQVTAYYLAQEGVEYMRNLRDGNFITQGTSTAGSLWDQGLTSCTVASPCGLNPVNAFGGSAAGGTVYNNGNALTNCTSLLNCRVYRSSAGLFMQVDNPDSNLTPTNFYRIVSVTPLNSSGPNYEDKVTVTVYWTTGNIKSPSNFQISENLFNWNYSIGTAYTPPATPFQLTVTKSGTGAGSVSSNPAGINNCTSSCTANFDGGTVITLTASEGGASVFLNWTSGVCSGANPVCTFTISATSSTNAKFIPGGDGGGN